MIFHSVCANTHLAYRTEYYSETFTHQYIHGFCCGWVCWSRCTRHAYRCKHITFFLSSSELNFRCFVHTLGQLSDQHNMLFHTTTQPVVKGMQVMVVMVRHIHIGNIVLYTYWCMFCLLCVAPKANNPNLLDLKHKT